MEDGRVGEWELLLEEDTNPSADHEAGRDYTEPGALVPGSKRVEYFYTRTSQEKRNVPLILPIYDYGLDIREKSQPLEGNQVREAIEQVFEGKRMVNGISGDHFYGATGPVTWEEYLLPGGAYPYHDKPLIPIEYHSFGDVNGDGQSDYIVKLRQPKEEFGDPLYVVLALEEGEVYAYFFGFTDSLGVDPNGSIYFQEFGEWRRVSFYQDQCYSVPAEPVEGCDLAWDPFGSV